MSSANYVICGFALLMTVIFCSESFAQDSILDEATVVAVVPVVKGDVDRRVLRRFDLLVPELKKISRDKIIKLECRYAGQTGRERDVLSAYQIASRIEKYLRVRHKLDLDLWITIRMASKQTKPSPVFTIAVLADDIKRLNSLPVESGKTGEH
jgi:hypothetical protein